ncbi:hypothetical protein EDC01DRAFT_689443 [Geopyxis carbonaria]|nr:hypothetical protein EDC01DRAFT_689443 [Geopyxis carbonaria]
MLIAPASIEASKGLPKLNTDINQQTNVNRHEPSPISPEDMHSGFSVPAEIAADLPTYGPEESTASQTPHNLYVCPSRITKMAFYFQHYQPNDSVISVFKSHGTLNQLLTNHIKDFQRKAFKLWPYPCIGMYEFVKFNLPTYPNYRELLALLNAGGLYLDLGCCVGQDLRHLSAAENIPAEHLYGVDLKQEFIDLGYELFLDRDHFEAHFGVSDVFDTSEDSWLIKECKGRMSVVHVGYFLHLFEYEKQVEVCQRIVELLMPKSGVMVVGRSTGSVEPGLFKHPTSGNMFRHNPESFEAMWKLVGDMTGKLFDVVCIGEPFVGRVSSGGEVFRELGVKNPLELMFSVTMKEAPESIRMKGASETDTVKEVSAIINTKEASEILEMKEALEISTGRFGQDSLEDSASVKETVDDIVKEVSAAVDMKGAPETVNMKETSEILKMKEALEIPTGGFGQDSLEDATSAKDTDDVVVSSV